MEIDSLHLEKYKSFQTNIDISARKKLSRLEQLL